jgi:hypothetical protein
MRGEGPKALRGLHHKGDVRWVLTRAHERERAVSELNQRPALVMPADLTAELRLIPRDGA